MTETNATASRRGRRWIALAVSLILVVAVGWYWNSGKTPTQATTSGPPVAVAEPVSYPAPGKEPSARTEFPAGGTLISGPEITAALSDHTALLPGGFVEYYAPDGKLHGMTEGKHYGGSWEVRSGTFCTLLQDSDTSVCSAVARKDNTLYWSVDGEGEASPVSTMPGNPRGLN